MGGRKQTTESVLAETRNAYRAYDGLGCDVLAMVANRVAREDRDRIAEQLASRLPVPCYVLPDEPALSAPTVSQIATPWAPKVRPRRRLRAGP
ncbi:Phosphate acetyltransferase OS=Streptomyces aurantiogriseus OX=66870 GN=pta PE=3 SV=1 [Streptomyces aurantiogriseus]